MRSSDAYLCEKEETLRSWKGPRSHLWERHFRPFKPMPGKGAEVPRVGSWGHGSSLGPGLRLVQNKTVGGGIQARNGEDGPPPLQLPQSLLCKQL